MDLVGVVSSIEDQHMNIVSETAENLLFVE